MDATRLLLALGGGLQHALSVARQLEELGLVVVEGGSVLHNGVLVVGKGTNSIVFLCRPRLGDFKLACKIRRGDSARESLIHEAQILHVANTVGVGPRIYAYSRDVVAYRFVDGVPVDEWWRAAGPQARRTLVEELMTQAYRLDVAGISHNELSRLQKHVLVEGGRPVIIDFESATVGGGNNVTQIANGLLRFGIRPPIEALRYYKRCLCRDGFEQVLSEVVSQV